MKQAIDKIIGLEEAKLIVPEWKQNGQKIVFTNGCFDLLHFGHLDYLEKSRALGDRLVVGVNSDSSINKLKGPDRPIISENSRLRMIASLQFVDLVVSFSSETPLNLIEALKPNILVKGSDYNINNIVGADVVLENGGKVELIDLVEGYSTTDIIVKIENLKK